MKSILKEQKRGSLISAVVTIVLGVVLLTWPDWAMKWMCILLGVVLAVTGAMYILGFFQRKKQGFSLYYSLVMGVILLGLGVWLLTNPGGLIRLVQYVFGALIVFHGVVDLQGAISLLQCSQGNDRWIALAFAAMTLALGMLVLINPFGTLAVLVMMVGVVLVFDGISDLWLIYKLSQVVQDVENALEQAREEADAIETEGRDLDQDQDQDE